MNLAQMKNCMNDIVENVSKKYVGGESYFTEIDANIKNNIPLLSSYFQWVFKRTHTPIILSGEIGEKIVKFQHLKIISPIPTVIVNGGLRNNNDITYIKTYPFDYSPSLHSKFIMIDDSYYSGKTVEKVRQELLNIGCILDNIYVFYDGSMENKDRVKSLYRYYLD